MNAPNQTTNPARASSRTYLNAVLTANALFLGLVALNGLVPSDHAALSGSVAIAQPYVGVGQPDDVDGGRVSAAEQRKMMINELRSMTSRLDRIEATMRAGLNVKVLSMPQMPDDKKADASNQSDKQIKPESRIEIRTDAQDNH